MGGKILLWMMLFSGLIFSQNLNLEQFWGVELGTKSIESKNIINASELTKGIGYGLKVGSQNYEWRTSFLANYFNKSEIESISATISIDKYLFSGIYETKDNIIKPYVGIHGGWLKHKGVGLKDDGLLYGGQIGIVWGLSYGFDLDLGYRNSFTAVDRVTIIDNLFFSINYIF